MAGFRRAGLTLALLLAMLASPAFAVGSGGSSSLKTFVLEQEYSCPDGTLTITAVTPDGTLSGVYLELTKNSVRLQDATTGPAGKATFKVGTDGAYVVRGSKSGYFNANILSSIKACAAPAPAETVYCTDGATVAERVRCVMGLPDDDVLNVRYVPEECRASEGEDREKCIGTYRLLQTCRIGFEGTDEEREECIKPKLNLSGDVGSDMAECGGDQACIASVRESVLTLVKFRMYNLVYKAEEMMGLGVSQDDVVDFVAYAEEAKGRFNEASSITGKKLVVQELKEEWEEFKARAREQMGVDE